jgi:hypothetical protein
VVTHHLTYTVYHTTFLYEVRTEVCKRQKIVCRDTKLTSRGTTLPPSGGLLEVIESRITKLICLPSRGSLYVVHPSQLLKPYPPEYPYTRPHTERMPISARNRARYFRTRRPRDADTQSRRPLAISGEL